MSHTAIVTSTLSQPHIHSTLLHTARRLPPGSMNSKRLPPGNENMGFAMDTPSAEETVSSTASSSEWWITNRAPPTLTVSAAKNPPSRPALSLEKEEYFGP
mmetsp:Transcript_27640/g.46748  ORF Transcript_27640/g.46748 Transcript_27640/m.46748 type:complete len:101 (+) Transcript_27640:387-689(+)